MQAQQILIISDGWDKGEKPKWQNIILLTNNAVFLEARMLTKNTDQ
jgi:hypothetical protein